MSAPLSPRAERDRRGARRCSSGYLVAGAEELLDGIRGALIRLFLFEDRAERFGGDEAFGGSVPGGLEGVLHEQHLDAGRRRLDERTQFGVAHLVGHVADVDAPDALRVVAE